MHFADASGAGPAIRHCAEGIDADAFPLDADEAKVSNAVFTQTLVAVALRERFHPLTGIPLSQALLCAIFQLSFSRG
jgi:hypothetical protein